MQIYYFNVLHDRLYRNTEEEKGGLPTLFYFKEMEFHASNLTYV